MRPVEMSARWLVLMRCGPVIHGWLDMEGVRAHRLLLSYTLQPKNAHVYVQSRLQSDSSQHLSTKKRKPVQGHLEETPISGQSFHAQASVARSN